MTDPEAVAYLDAAIAELAALPSVDPVKIAVAGVCQTGRHPLVLAAERPIAAALIWYGAASKREWQVDARYPKPLDEIIARVDCPVLGIFGEADHVISLDDVRRLRDCSIAMTRAIRSSSIPARRMAGSTTPCPAATAVPQAEAGWALQLAFLEERARSELRPLAPDADLRMRAFRRL